MSVTSSNILQKKHLESAINRDALYMDAMMARTFTTKKGAEEWLKGFQAPKDSELRQKAVTQMVESFNVVNDVMSNRPNDVYSKHKTVTSTVGLITPQQVVQWMNAYDELTLDNEWTSIFRMDDLTGGFMGSIGNIRTSIRFERVNDKTDPAPMGTYAKGDWETFGPEFYKGGLRIANSILQKDPLTSLNLIFVAIRWKMMETKSGAAYEMINAMIAAASAAGYVQSFTTSPQKTLSLGRVALLRRLKGKGYGISRGLQTRIFGALELEGDIETIFAGFSPNTNQVAVNYKVVGNYTRHYSLNLATDLALSGPNACAIIAPGLLNNMGIFENVKLNQDSEILTDTTLIVASEDYIFRGEEQQVQVINLA